MMINDKIFIWDGKSSVPRDVENVKIADGVTEIGGEVFFNCQNLKEITIPDNVTKIGADAFSDCMNLENITIPDGVTEIGERAFASCENLKEITIPDGVTKIGTNTFRSCYNLKEITIPDSVTEIGGYAFASCKSLKEITIPDGVTEICHDAFWGCESLENITIPDSVTRIGESAFHNCDNLKEITIPDSVTEIGKRAFCDCMNLENITIPDSVIKICDEAFYDCNKLKEVTIPDGVTEIGFSAFRGCQNLKEITIPDSVTEIGEFAFIGCESIERILYKNHDIKPYLDYDAYGEDNFKITKQLLDNNVNLNMHMFEKAVSAAHAGRLDTFCENYTIFGDMTVTPSMKVVSEDVKSELRTLFQNQSRTGKRIPRCLDKLAITSNSLRISPEDIVKNFDIDYTANIIKNEEPFVPNIANRCYYSKEICNQLNEKELSSLVAETIGSFNSSKKSCYKYAADFVVSHMNTNIDILQETCKHAESFDVDEKTTVDDIKKAIFQREAMGEVFKINEEYDINLMGCKCNIPLIKTDYDNRVSRVLDFNKESDIMLAARLGYLTNCCQHLDSEGETAMMHGFLNPDAGFFVIEDKNGSVKAQAEIWLADKDTLVFDNIEFANTDSSDYEKRVKQLRGDVANFAKNSGYKNIIMGCGYNEFDFNKMEKAKVPKLKLTPEEVFILQEGNDAWVEFANVKEAADYMKSKDYDPDDFVYTDVNGEHGCVYIKHDGIVSNYLSDGYDKALSENHGQVIDIHRIKPNLNRQLPEIDYEKEDERQYV